MIKIISKEYFESLSFSDVDLIELIPVDRALTTVNFWDKDNAVLSINDIAFSFLTIRNPIYLNFIYVKCEYRKKGYGRKIMQAVKDFAEEKNIKEIEFYSRETSLGFYKKIGYEIISKDSRHYYKGSLK